MPSKTHGGTAGGRYGSPTLRHPKPTSSSGEVQRHREGRAAYLRQLRELQGVPEEPTPRITTVGAHVCCSKATLNASACYCGGIVTCPDHSPGGRCLGFTHD